MRSRDFKMEEFFGEFLSGPPEPVQLRLSRRALKRLRVLGIRNICITDHDENFGPYLKYYVNKRSAIYKQITENLAFLADILLLAKDTKEMLLRDERSLVLMEFLDRQGLRLAIVETTKEFRDNAIDFLGRLVEMINDNLIYEEIMSAIERIIEAAD